MYVSSISNTERARTMTVDIADNGIGSKGLCVFVCLCVCVCARVCLFVLMYVFLGTIGLSLCIVFYTIVVIDVSLVCVYVRVSICFFHVCVVKYGCCIFMHWPLLKCYYY